MKDISHLLEEFQDLICRDKRDYGFFLAEARKRHSELAIEAKALTYPILRFVHALRQLDERREGIADVLVLLRQVCRYHRPILLHPALWRQLESTAAAMSLGGYHDNGYIRVVAHDWQPYWLDNAEYIDQLVMRHATEPATGDGVLYALMRGEFASYRNPGQKRAVQAAMFAAEGSTLLVTLSTGSGKSLCITQPAFVASNGGTQAGGTTLVIVPTIALAFDQVDRAKAYFQNAASENHRPASITSDTDTTEFARICNGIRAGIVPIVYVSPEKLLNSSLYEVCLEAARRGNLTRLVIDEAHLVETWGAGFRTEFQLLATYRQRLYDVSDGKLITILLSATISEYAEQTLTQLFGNQGRSLPHVRGDQLRPEISYWFSLIEDEAQKKHHVREALRHLPRPTILYTTRKADAEAYYHLLRRDGFRRLALFTGNTKPNERWRIVRDWNRNEIDLIIGTSAFGLGVDKPDVRTIIHATVPESLDRFYQEVGRGGRDGMSAISLTCITREDMNLAWRMSTSQRITSEKAWERWQLMQRHKRAYQNIDVLNMRSNPNRSFFRRNDVDNEKNTDWNKHILLILQRAGRLRIVDTREQIQTQGRDRDNMLNQIPVQILDATSLNNEQPFKQAFEKYRQIERDTVRQGYLAVKRMIERFVQGHNAMCISAHLVDVYRNASLACGGCPYCRTNQRAAYAHPAMVEVDLGEVNTRAIHSRLHKLDPYSLHLYWAGHWEDQDVAIAQAIYQLVIHGVQQVVLPGIWKHQENSFEKLIQMLAHLQTRPHMLFFENEIDQLLSLNTVIVYPPRDDAANSLYKQWRSRKHPAWSAHIFRDDLYLPAENGRYIEKIRGYKDSLSHFVSTFQFRSY